MMYIEADHLADGIYNIKDGEIFKYKAKGGTVRTYKIADIVRCKECRHWIGETEHYEDREYKACWQLCGQYMNSEFWCKYGEREGE